MGSLPHVVEDCSGILQVYSDGSIFRSKEEDINFPFPVHDDDSVHWKDSVFDRTHGLNLRIYKPRSSAAAVSLPIVFFFHGGGFCVGSRTWPNCHSCCLRLCAGLQAVVVAPDYRLAPEHRLPAAMDDAFCAVKLGVGSPEMAPVRVRGYVMMAPFFGGTERTKSEAEGPPEPFLNLEILDRFWRLSLPFGGTPDHPLANPFGPASPSLEAVKLDPILVIVGSQEVLKDRVENYAMKLKEQKKEVDYVVFQGKQHGFFTNDPFSDVSIQVLQELQHFMSKV
nr:probable carboxylesterase 15 [Ipomoea batatas]